MSTLLYALTNGLMNMFGSIGTLGADADWGELYWLENIVDAVDILLYPIMALVATAGIIYAIVLGVNLAKAESSEKRDEAKKRMINAIIGFVSIIALVALMKLTIAFLPNLLGLTDTVTPSTSSTSP